MPLESLLKSLIRDVLDFPKPGIVFKDITPLLADPDARRRVVESIVEYYAGASIDAVVAVEARGFIFGALIAEKLGVPLIPIRKAGKLPYKKVKRSYSLEYGTATIEIHEDAIHPGWNVLLHDDLLATGGTAMAAAELVNDLKGQLMGFSFIVNLSFLPGEKLLGDRFGIKPHFLIKY